MWYRFRAEARRGWKVWLAVGVLVGLGSGAVLALIAGARRTDTAINRFADKANAWDVQVISGTPGLFDFAEVDLHEVAALPGVADAAPVFVLAVEAKTSDGVRMGSESINFSVDPAGRLGSEFDRVKMLEGRRADPADPGEVIVSFRTAELARLDVGDSISATFVSIEALVGGDDPAAPPPTTSSAELRVVGIYTTVRELAGSGTSSGFPADVRLTPPAFERHRHSAARTDLQVVGVAALPDVGAVVALGTLRRIVPNAPTQLALARVTEAAELGAFVKRATAALGLTADDAVFPELSEAVANFGRVERLPVVLAALMGLLAMGTLLHALLLSVGRRRRELSVLKVLGFTRRQVLATVATQTSVLTAVSLAMGVALGIAAGRLLWLRFADGLGVVPVAVAPVLTTGLVVALFLLIANLASILPGLRAARTPAAKVLRSE